MRASAPKGRFTTDYELESIHTGIDQDLQRPVGMTLDWYRFDPINTVKDPIYDVGASTGGRRWVFPAMHIPAITAVIHQGMTVQNNRGFYQSDVLRATFNASDIKELLPNLRTDPTPYYLDRVVYLGEVFTVTRIYLRGNVANDWTVMTFDANQVNKEELVNDPQFQGFAQP